MEIEENLGQSYQIIDDISDGALGHREARLSGSPFLFLQAVAGVRSGARASVLLLLLHSEH
jgi:hypothetical protein